MRKIFLIMLIMSQFMFAESKLTIKNVEILNNKEVPIEVIESNMDLKIGTTYTAELMVKDYIRLKNQDYIEDLKIYPEIEPDGIKLIVNLTEKSDIMIKKSLK